MKPITLTLLGALALTLGACSKVTPPPNPGVPSTLRDPSKVADPIEQERIRAANSQKYRDWNYQPAEKKGYEP